uniref:Uncharacterized protein n=1 Tax=Panagrolaimus superbus TaxID=310955 RepID=A0A914YI19_9BILA
MASSGGDINGGGGGSSTSGGNGNTNNENSTTNASGSSRTTTTSRSTTERVIKSVQFPISERLGVDDVYDRRAGKPKSDVLKDHFIKEGRIEEEAALRIINGKIAYKF